MSRSNTVPIRMKVEGNRLVPASAFDQEYLNSYQNGAVLQVYFWQGRNPDLLRKFWAILSRVIETCKTPWEDKEEAADALKLALGITDVGSTINGQMFVRPGSISFASMDEARFRKFFDDAMALLHRITGVDPIELGKEAADTGSDHEPHDPITGEIIEHETSDAGGNHASGDNSADPSPGAVEEGPAGVSPAPAGPDEPSMFPSRFNFAAGELDHLKDLARKALDDAASDSDAPAKEAAIDRLFLNYAEVLLSEDARKALKAMGTPIAAVINRKRSREQAAGYIAKELLDCPVSEMETFRHG